MKENLSFFSKKLERILKNKSKEKNFSRNRYFNNKYNFTPCKFTYFNYSKPVHIKILNPNLQKSKNTKKREVKS